MLIKKVKEFNLKNWAEQSKTQIIILVVLTLIAYAGTLNHEFLSDDIFGIVNNPLIDQWSNVTGSFPHFIQAFIYFFITNIFGTVPAVFRTVNIFFHLGIVLIAYLLIYFLHQRTTAFITALLMGIHPIIIESVTWISGGIYTIYGFFILLAFLFFILGHKDDKYYYASIISFLLAIFTSIQAIIYPFILTAFLLFWPEAKIKKNWKKLIIPWTIGAVFIFISVTGISGRLETLQTDYYQQPTLQNPLEQIPTAVSKYLELIFWPEKLTLYQTEISLINQALFIRLAFIFVIFTLIGLSTLFYNKKLFFWFAFFGLALGPTLTPFGVSWLVAERYSRLAVLGIFVLVGLAITKLNKIRINETKNLPLIAFIAIVIPILTLRTMNRNQDWQSQDTLWLAAAKYSPNSAQNHNNLGDLYARHGDFEKSITHFQQAIKLLPNYADAYHNLATVYWRLEEIETAIENYEKAVEYNPNIWQTRQNLGILYFEIGDQEKGIEFMEKAIQLNPYNPNLFANIAIMHEQMGENQKAAEAFARYEQLAAP